MNRIVLVAPLLYSLAAQAEPTRDYVVKPGDTCIGIVTRELGDRDQLDTLHRLNPQLGPTPHKLVPGQVLKLPAISTAADAHLTQQHGPVEVRRAGEPAWFKADTGADLFRAWRVGSRDEATAQVTFSDQSAIAMRENTVVVIYGRTAAAATSAPFRAQLESGALRSRLAELDGRPIVVDTPAGTATLVAGSAVLDVDKKGATKISNHRGKPVALASHTRVPRTVAIGTGFGSEVALGADPTPPRPLPPTPVWTSGSDPVLALGWQGQGATVHATWQPVAEAVSYRVELARDKDLSAVEAKVVVGAVTSDVETRAVPPGTYYLSVAAIDAKGFESVPAPVREVRVVELPVAAAATFAPGTDLAAPDGVTCGVAGGSMGSHAIVGGEGTVAIECAGAGGARGSIDVTVGALRVASWTATIAAGAEADVDIALDGPFGGALVAHAPAGLSITATTPTPTGARFHVRADASLSAGSAPLALALSSSGAELPLGAVDVTITRTTPLPAAAAKASLPIGFEPSLGYTTRDDVDHNGVRAGMQLSVYPLAWLGLEVGGWRGFHGAASTTLHAGVVLAYPWVITPALRGGIIKWTDDRGPGGYLGAELSVPVAHRADAMFQLDFLDDGDGPRLQSSFGVRLRLE
ncbi:MAG TPA: FecR domain-containing protein [Kofleriaceae bacterium]|jgi:hypothetical protein